MNTLSFSINNIHHYGFTVRDLKKSADFYCNKMGLQKVTEVTADGKNMEELTDLKGASLRAVLLKFPENMQGNLPLVELIEYVKPKGKYINRKNNDIGNAHLAVVVDNIDSAFSQLKKKGVHFNCAPFLVSHGPLSGMKITYITDPDGITIEMMGRAESGSL